MTLSAVARAAGVAVPTVSAVFGSKKGIVAELLDQARFGQDYQALVRQAMLVSTAERLSFAASIARRVYESEIPVQSLLRGQECSRRSWRAWKASARVSAMKYRATWSIICLGQAAANRVGPQVSARYSLDPDEP